MSAVRLAWSELRRLTAGRLPKVAILALALIPTLYAGLYLFANGDPYSHLDRVPAAIVLQDTGAEQDGATVSFGRTVADQLVSSGGFAWRETDEKTAQEGVRTGEFDAALVIGPDFSSALVSSGNLEPRQATLTLVTNDANNYLARTIATSISDKVRDSIASQVGTKAASTFLTGFVTIHSSISKAVDGTASLRDGAAQLASGATSLADGITSVDAGAHQVSDGASTLAAGSSSLASGLGTLESKTAALPSQASALSTGAAKVATGASDLATAGATVSTGATGVSSAIGSLRAQLAAAQTTGLTSAEVAALLGEVDQLQGAASQVAGGTAAVASGLGAVSAGAGDVSTGAAGLSTAVPSLSSAIGTAADGAARLSTGATDLAAGAGDLAAGTTTLSQGTPALTSGAGSLVDGATTLHDSLASGLTDIPNPDADTIDATATTLGNPLAVTGDALAAAGSYGAGLAPFFLSLSAWIGAYVLFLLVRPLSQRAIAAGRSAWRTAVGGLLTPAAIGVAQMAAMFTVVKLALHIAPVHPWMTALYLVLISVTFVAILQALNALLGTAGQFLGLVLMLTQLVTAGGTFPWQTLPDGLRGLHRFLPMSYGVEGLRQLLYGGDLALAARDGGLLLTVFVLALVATTLTALRRRVWIAKQLQPELVL